MMLLSYTLLLILFNYYLMVNGSTTDYECPSTTTALGPVGTRFDNSVRDFYSERLSSSSTIDDCETICRSYTDCVAFEYSYSCSWYYTYNQCSLYTVVGPVTEPTTTSYYRRWSLYNSYDKAGSCAIDTISDQTCPAGTDQGGRQLGDWPGSMTPTVFELGTSIGEILTLEDCRAACCEDDDCDAFSYVDAVVEDFPTTGIDTQLTLCGGYDDQADLDAVSESGTFENRITCELTTNGCPSTLECPAGSSEVSQGAEFGVNGRSVGFFRFKTIEECAEECRCDEDCFFFSFDDDFGGASWCQLFETGQTGDDYPSTSGLYQIITCQIEACPDGSSQIGGPGDALDPNNYIVGGYTRGLTINECKAACDANSNCVAFTFDYDIYSGWYQRWVTSYDKDADNGCWEYSSAERADEPVRLSARDGVSCEVTVGSSARSIPQYLNFEAITNEAGHGATTTQNISISVYIIYGVIGLIMVNIICLIINCCIKNKNGNGKSYKVVSVRSEDDSTDM